MFPNKLIVTAMTLVGGCALAQMPGMGPQHVQVEKAVMGKDSISRRSIGHVEAQKTVHVRAAVEGFLMDPEFREGSIVQAGDVLFRIYPVRYEAALKQAEATLAEINAKIAFAEASSRRIARLAKAQATSKEDAETARTKVEELKARKAEAEANYTKARKDLEDCCVKAEITGRIGRMEFAPGNYVTRGEKLATITQTDPIYVRFPLSQSDVNGIFRGPKEIGNVANVKFTTAAGQRYPHPGKVEIVDNMLTANTDTYTLWATFPNKDEVLTNSGIGALHIELNDNQEVVQVPLTAVHHDKQGAFVYVVGEGNVVERRKISAGSICGRLQSVYNGLQAGEVVVTDGSHKTRVGSTVVPVYPEQQVIRGVKTGKLADIATPVQMTSATMVTDPTVITCQGAHVETINSINLRPLVQGILQEQNFKEGDVVEKGAVLFNIDPTRYQAAVDAQEARITQLKVKVQDATSKYERQLKLLSNGATSQEDVDSAKASVDELKAQQSGAEAALAIAKDDLSRCVIHAGLQGRIGRAAVSPGNYIPDMQTPLARLVQLSPIYVRFSLSETALLSHFGDAEHLMKDADITLVTATGDPHTETGHVAFSDNVIQIQTDTRNIWAVFPNADATLQPGGVVTIQITRKPELKVMSLPANTVLTGTNGHYVFVCKDGRATATRVWCGDVTEDGRRIIYSGITPEDKVITSRLAELENGDAVSEEPAPAAKN